MMTRTGRVGKASGFCASAAALKAARVVTIRMRAGVFLLRMAILLWPRHLATLGNVCDEPRPDYTSEGNRGFPARPGRGTSLARQSSTRRGPITPQRKTQVFLRDLLSSHHRAQLAPFSFVVLGPDRQRDRALGASRKVDCFRQHQTVVAF